MRHSSPSLVLLASTLLTTALSAGAAPLKALVLSGSNNHDWRATTPVIVATLEASGLFEVTVTEHPEEMTAASLAEIDVLVSNWNSWQNAAAEAWPPAARDALIDGIRGGKGLVSLHAGSSSFYDWPEFQDLVISSWNLQTTGHGAMHEFDVRPTAIDHPITRGVRPFLTTDELWHRVPRSPGARVLATAFSNRAGGGSGDEEAILSVRPYGKGRSVSFLLGHDAKAMSNPAFGALLVRSAEWAATGAVTAALPDAWPEPALAFYIDRVRACEGAADRGPFRDFARLVRDRAGEPQAAAALATAIVETLDTPMPTEAKRFLIVQVGLLGVPATADALAPFAGLPDTATAARGALEALGGPWAAAALIRALETAVPETVPGILHSLGIAGGETAVPALVRFIDAESADVRTAAIQALGRVGGPAARAALSAHAEAPGTPSHEAWCDALATCADRLLAEGAADDARAVFTRLSADGVPPHIRRRARIGLLASRADTWPEVLPKALADPDPASRSAALRVLQDAPSDALGGVLPALTDAFDTFPASVQLALPAAVARRGDSRALPILRKAAGSPEAPVRLEAYEALTRSGGDEAAGVLFAALQSADAGERSAVLRALSGVESAAADARLIAGLQPADGALVPEYADLLTARRATAAVPALLDVCRTGPPLAIRAAARALGELAGADRVPAVLALAESAGGRVADGAVEKTVSSICNRLPEGQQAGPALAALVGADAPRTLLLLNVLASAGGPDALQEVVTRTGAGDAAIRGGAVRALARWQDPAAIEPLVALGEKTDDPVERALALRGACRLLTEGTTDSAGLVPQLVRALPLARTPMDVQALLGAAAALPCAEGLAFARSALDDPQTRETAARTVLAVAPAVAGTDRRGAVAALWRVAVLCGGTPVSTEAEAAAVRLGAGDNLAARATADSPTGLSPDNEGGPASRAIDGNPGTYWDEQDDQALYRIRLTFPEPTTVATLLLSGWAQENYAPRDFDVLADDAKVAELRGARYVANELTVSLDPVSCTTLELRITGCYGRSPAIRELEVYGPMRADAADEPRALAWERGPVSVALTDRGIPVWCFRHDSRQAKPFFHPVALPGGRPLTWEGPPDHPWHHALWFSWKYLNGVNYWEENPETGLSAGLTRWGEPVVETRPDFSCGIAMDLTYAEPDGPVVLSERRTIDVSPPAADGTYRLDWTMTFRAEAETVELNRTPLPGEEGGAAHGGYAGLSVRFSPSLKGWQAVGSDGKTGMDLHGVGLPALDFSGVDGAAAAGIAFLDHPDNLNAPSPWYLVMNPGVPFAYVGAAVVFHQPVTFRRGEEFTLCYRVVVHPGRRDPQQLSEAAAAFAGGRTGE